MKSMDSIDEKIDLKRYRQTVPKTLLRGRDLNVFVRIFELETCRTGLTQTAFSIGRYDTDSTLGILTTTLCFLSDEVVNTNMFVSRAASAIEKSHVQMLLKSMDCFCLLPDDSKQEALPIGKIEIEPGQTLTHLNFHEIHFQQTPQEEKTETEKTSRILCVEFCLRDPQLPFETV